jgi:GNAT superfamily N-acetyltransferase
MDARIQSYLRVAASRVRDTERVGPFLATFSRHSANPYLNYALPDDGATPSPDHIDTLVAAYRQRHRTPRLEYLPGVAPAVEAALLARGFVVQARLPVMVCVPGGLRPVPAPAGIELVPPRSDAALLAAATMQHQAFDDPAPVTGADLASLRDTIRAGGLVVLARETRSSAPVGIGLCSVPCDGVTELAGIGVHASFRRRGIAGAITAWLAREAFAAGVTTAFLTPVDHDAGRVYARAGFAATDSTVLHLWRAPFTR